MKIHALKRFLLISVAVGCALFGWIASPYCQAQDVLLAPLRPSGIYDIGQDVGWTVKLAPGAAATMGKYGFVIRKNNLDVIKSGQFDLSTGQARVDVSVGEPAMLCLQIKPPPGAPIGKLPIAAGAAIAPLKLQPSSPRPSDFDTFWRAKIDLLQRIAPNPVLTPGDSGVAGVDYATIRMDHINDTHVYGQIAKPKRDGRFPALVIFQWASPPYPLQKSWVTGHAAAGWLTLNIEPHDVLPDQPRSYYDALPRALKNYQSIGQDDRDKSYFLLMYLADYRAVDYMTTRPDWDGKTLVVMGTSMGGQQSLCVAGLHPRITHVIVDEPSGCDTNGPLHGRQSGYPNFPSNDPAIMRTALYFDAVNFAPHIKATSLVAMGFVDTTAPPAGIWTAFNQISAPKEAVPMIDSPHNHLATDAQQRPYTSRSAQWLDILVHAGRVEPVMGN
jgi:cephalosporin-C deacetylase-like acetyl esterase